MKLILTGFMFSGKSSVAKELSSLLRIPAIDMDDLVLTKSQRTSIAEIFEKDGESTFRQLERQVAVDVTRIEHAVIATGGGVGINKGMLDALRENGKVIFLETSFEHILKRVGEDTSRPLMQNKDEAETLYKVRLPFYKEYADLHIKTDNKAIPEIAKQILESIHI